jgi:rhodanese-related sulfurtransferase
MKGKSLKNIMLFLCAAIFLGLITNELRPGRLPIGGLPPSDNPKICESLDYKIPRISPQEAFSLFYQKPGVFFVDARSEREFVHGHIKGAKNIPVKGDNLDLAKLDQINNAKSIIAYCDRPDCGLCMILARRLKELGFMDIKVIEGGYPEWKKLKLPISKSRQSIW